MDNEGYFGMTSEMQKYPAHQNKKELFESETKPPRIN